jgi:hypothetical protein
MISELHPEVMQSQFQIADKEVVLYQIIMLKYRASVIPRTLLDVVQLWLSTAWMTS